MPDYNAFMDELSPAHRRTLISSGCELSADMMTRQLYATDASIYRLEPAAVAFPRNAHQIAALMFAAKDLGIEITPRGAGTGLAGGALGSGLIIDVARHHRQIDELDRESRTVRVGAGVVLDSLNRALGSEGLMFGPDVATSSRATIGGMVANNSSGAHAPVYGTTLDHVHSLEIVLADGTVAWVGHDQRQLEELADSADALIHKHEAAIRSRFKTKLVKRWPGYGFDRWLQKPGDLTGLIAGSEGTLAVVASAVLRVVPTPSRRELGVLFFGSVEEAMKATVGLLDLEPAAVEHIDHHVFDQTRGQRAFAAARELLSLDDLPTSSLLLVEFFGEDSPDRLQMLERYNEADRSHLCLNHTERELVWSLRRAGLSLLTGCKGPAKPVAGIEDVCIKPVQLPEYVTELRRIIEPLGLDASFYGHAASGELHVRPKLDLHRNEDVKKFRQVADEVSQLCLRFEGSFAGEHGVGIARTEFMKEHIGNDLAELSGSIKRLFDPDEILNPGKIVDTGRFKIDSDLRLGPGSEIQLPFREALGYVDRDESFTANLEQCNGCGGCRKELPTMCPTFLATGDEALSTRGRANIIRAALDGRLDWHRSPVLAAEVEEVLSTCLSCKACKSECPSNVDLALLKAELRHARHRLVGPQLLDRLVASADLLGRVGTRWPRFANRLLESHLIRRLMQRAFGLNAERSILEFADERFDRWYSARRGEGQTSTGETVLLWDDTWTRYHEPGPGRAATRLLERLGYDVRLLEDRHCCGRPAFSRGLLRKAAGLARHNLELLRLGDSHPILFLEPSCYSMFVDEYRQLGIRGADEVAARCWLLEEFILDRLGRSLDAFGSQTGVRVAIHAHCHAQALAEAGRTAAALGRFEGVDAELLDTGCCGMAGAFGLEKKNEGLSRSVAKGLLETIGSMDEEVVLLAAGTSCRHQIRDLGNRAVQHPVEFLESLIRNAQSKDQRTNPEKGA